MEWETHGFNRSGDRCYTYRDNAIRKPLWLVDIDRIIPTGYGSFATVFQGRQNNINMYGSTKGNYSLFGTDEQQAQDVAQFRQTHCSGLSGATCDGFVQEALDDRMKRAGILTAAAIAVPVGVNRFRSLRLPGKPIATKIKPVTSGGGANTDTVSQGMVANAGARGSVRGSVANGNFAQKTASEAFSVKGAAEYTRLAGTPIKTVSDLAGAISSGRISPSQIPVGYVVTSEGTVIIANTRTSAALTQAGVPKSQWYGINQSNVPVPGLNGNTFTDLVNAQLKRNGLPLSGTPNLPKPKGVK